MIITHNDMFEELRLNSRDRLNIYMPNAVCIVMKRITLELHSRFLYQRRAPSSSFASPSSSLLHSSRRPRLNTSSQSSHKHPRWGSQKYTSSPIPSSRTLWQQTSHIRWSYIRMHLYSSLWWATLLRMHLYSSLRHLYILHRMYLCLNYTITR